MSTPGRPKFGYRSAAPYDSRRMSGHALRLPRRWRLSDLAGAAGVGAAASALALLAACATPPVPSAPARPDIPAQLPAMQAAAGDAALPAWRDWVADPALQRLVELALAHNRDLQVAVLSVQRAQAQLSAVDANRWPVVGLGAGAQRAPNGQGQQANTLSAGVQLASWEIDLFGRLQGMSDAARAQLLATRAGQRAAELSLTAAVVQAGLAVRADEQLLAIARRSLAGREDSLRLVRLRESAGAASLLDLQAQLGLTAQARVSLAQLQRQREQDGNALNLLLGQPAPADALAAGGDQLATLAELPVGLSSDVLLRRPDVVQAEQLLLSARANLGAARAALWPSITLTAQAGQVSSQLSGLFEGGNFAYTVASNLFFAVFDGGRRRANIDAADSSERIALAQYERAVQAAFRDTADALAGVATWRAQLDAQRQQRDAARETARLTGLKLQYGAASALEMLEAERSLYAAEQAVVQTRLAELANRVALYKALAP